MIEASDEPPATAQPAVEPKQPAAQGGEEGEEEPEEPDLESEEEEGEDPEPDEGEGETSESDEEGEEEGEEPESEEEEESPESEEIPKGWPKSAHKRLSKVTAQRNEAIQEAERLREQLRQSHEAPIALQPTEANPLGNVRSEQDLAQFEQNQRLILNWCKANRDGGEYRTKEGTHELDADQVRDLEDSAREALSLHVPQRRSYLAEYAQHNAKAKLAYPALFEPGRASDYAMDLIKRVPSLANLPDHVLLLGDAHLGYLVRTAGAKVIVPGAEKPAANGSKAKAKAKAAPKPAAKATPTAKPRAVDPSGAARVNAAPKDRDIAAIRARAAEGDDEAMAALGEIMLG